MIAVGVEATSPADETISPEAAFDVEAFSIAEAMIAVGVEVTSTADQTTSPEAAFDVEFSIAEAMIPVNAEAISPEAAFDVEAFSIAESMISVGV